jgi:hypothetical protein
MVREAAANYLVVCEEGGREEGRKGGRGRGGVG